MKDRLALRHSLGFLETDSEMEVCVTGEEHQGTILYKMEGSRIRQRETLSLDAGVTETQLTPQEALELWRGGPSESLQFSSVQSLS